MFYVFLEILRKYPALDAERIRNCNERGFPTDACKGTAIAAKVNRIYLNN